MRILGLLLTLTNILISGFSGYADVSFRFAANSIDEGGLKTRMEGNISDLLTEINRSGFDGDSLNLSGINMNQTEGVSKFRCTLFYNML